MRPMGAASALPMGTRRAPPFPGASLPAPEGFENGLGGTFAGAVLLPPSVFALPSEGPSPVPPESFARFTFSFSSVPAARVRDAAAGLDDSALPLPFSFADSLGAAGRAPGGLRFATFACVFSRSAGGLSSDMPSSSARLLGGARTGGAIVATGVGECSSSPSISLSRAPRRGRSMSGLSGEFASMRIRLRGLGFAGEYAWIMRTARGFATGKGR